MAARMMTFGLLAVLAIGWLHGAMGQFDCSQTEITVEAIEDCVNAVRSDPGRYAASMCGADVPSGTLWPDGALTSAAQFHNNDMAARGFFGHGDFSGRIYGAGFSGGEIGENLANGYSSAFAVVAGWMCSPGHRRNLVNCNYDSIGTAVDCVSGMAGGCLVTQTYGCSTGSCCGGGGRGPAPSRSEEAAEVTDVLPEETPVFGGFLSRIFGAPTAPPAEVQGEFEDGSGETEEQPASGCSPFQIFCRLLGGGN